MNYTENILSVYEQSTPQERQHGRSWYPSARRQCQSIQGVPLRISAGVVAALSPNNKWTKNVSDAERTIQAFLSGYTLDDFKVCTYNKMKEKAWSILQEQPKTHDEVAEILNGRKITSFFHNIVGRNTCTIDGHAYSIAHGTRMMLQNGGINLGKKKYEELQQAYISAGQQHKLKAYQMQAITWVTWKRIYNV